MEVTPILDDPEHAEMTWTPFAKWFQEEYSKKIVSFECFHTGTTTSVRKSTIRTTSEGHHVVLVIGKQIERRLRSAFQSAGL